MVASSQKSSLWVITLHKIVLAGDDAPQNHSCGVVLPPQQHSCKEKKVNTKCKWNTNEDAKEGNIFLLFLMNLERNKSKESRGRKNTGWNWLSLGKGSAMSSLCTGSYRGALPHSRPTKVVGRPCDWPNFCPPFSVMLNDCHMIQRWVSECRGRLVQA